MKVSSSRLIRIITGALAFFDNRAGMIIEIPPVILLPNPPPVYSLILGSGAFSRLRSGRTGLLVRVAIQFW
jgi:hypothetical protein